MSINLTQKKINKINRSRKIDEVFGLINEIKEDFRLAWNERNITELQYLRAKTSFDIDCLKDLIDG